MNFDRTGIILYTINYKKCEVFYREVLELNVMFTKEGLTCFEFGGAYLLVEQDDLIDEEATGNMRIKTCLRMNVPDVKLLSQKLIAKGVHVELGEYTWGTVAKFKDPDGNLCALKDSYKFEMQVRGMQI